MTNETVDDIERELREYGDRPPPRRAWIDLADRLHAAYKRDIDNSLAENARLKEDIFCVVRCGVSTCGCMIECRACPVTRYIGGEK